MQLFKLDKVILIFTLAIAVTGCSTQRKEIHETISNSEEKFITGECELNKLFSDEPEFFELRDQTFCVGYVRITRLEKISDTDAIANYEIKFIANQDNLDQWLRAYKKFTVRVKPSIEQQKVSDLVEKVHHESRDWVYENHEVKLSNEAGLWVIDDVIH